MATESPAEIAGRATCARPTQDSSPAEQAPSLSSDAASLRERLRLAFADLADGDAEALGRAWDLVAERLYGLALWRCGRPAEAADAVQEAWIRLARAARQGRLGHVVDPLAYLLTITRRCAVDQVRLRREHDDLHELTDSELHLLVPTNSAPEVEIDARDASRQLCRLPTDQREAVYLRVFAGLSFREIGDATDVPLFTAASRFRLGLQKLRTLLSVPTDARSHENETKRDDP